MLSVFGTKDFMDGLFMIATNKILGKHPERLSMKEDGTSGLNKNARSRVGVVSEFGSQN